MSHVENVHRYLLEMMFLGFWVMTGVITTENYSGQLDCTVCRREMQNANKASLPTLTLGLFLDQIYGM